MGGDARDGVPGGRCLRRPWPWLAVWAVLCAAQATGAARPPAPGPAALQGERIYRDGVLPDGSPLRGQREDAPAVTGRDAACVNCHGRSGMGVVEGRTVVPPITAAALFHPGERPAPVAGHEHALATPPTRGAYTDQTLARAIREGVDPEGRTLDYVMPRFALDQASTQAVLAHLRQLSAGRTPGVVNDELNFATIITPDADPVARQAMLAVLRAFFAQKNDFSHDEKGTVAQDNPQRRFRVLLRWRLHEWQLSGAPDTWERQLDEKLRAEPVFAVISGLGGRDWAPVHAFCEHRAVPCLFPNVDLPVVAEDDFYPVYFSRGVLLEGDLVAARLAGPGAKPARVVQVYRGGDIGAAPAGRVRRALAAAGVPVVDRVLAPGDDASALARAVAQARSGEALVLWLRGEDLARLPPALAVASSVFVSAILGGLEAAPLPAAWRASAVMAYGYALPDERRVLLNYPLGWLRSQHIPVTDARVQVDTYIACSILGENLISTHGSFLRDFLVERVEARVGSDLLSGYFKRLSLAHGQRFAAKGGYLVRFAGADGARVEPVGDWFVP